MQLRLRIEKKTVRLAHSRLQEWGRGGGGGGEWGGGKYLLGGIRDKGKDTEVHQVCSKMTKTMVVVC